MSKKSTKDTKKFHIGDILGVMTGITCVPNGFSGVCDLLTFMCDESPYTTQAGRFAEECRPYLAEQFPQFTTINAEDLTGGPEKNALAVDKLVEQFGAFHVVRKMHHEDHAVIDAIEEFKRDFPDVPAFGLNVTEGE